MACISYVLDFGKFVHEYFFGYYQIFLPKYLR